MIIPLLATKTVCPYTWIGTFCSLGSTCSLVGSMESDPPLGPIDSPSGQPKSTQPEVTCGLALTACFWVYTQHFCLLFPSWKKMSSSSSGWHGSFTNKRYP